MLFASFLAVILFVIGFSFDTLTAGEHRVFDRFVLFFFICVLSISGYFSFKFKEKIPENVQEWIEKMD